MEVQLSTADFLQDTFVSVRVGDVQKQARLAASRTYYFPSSADAEGRGRFGRIEVFKRVGDVTVDFARAQGGAQTIEVPCSLPGKSAIQMNLAVKGGPAEPMKVQDVKGRGQTRWAAAQMYLADFNLEESLAEAMREVIREKPEDPYTYLAELLSKYKGAAAKSKPAMQPVAEPVAELAIASALVPAANEPATYIVPATVATTRNAWKVSPSVGTWYAPLRRPAPHSKPKPITPTVSSAFHHKPSVGSWLAFRPVSSLKQPAQQVMPVGAAPLTAAPQFKGPFRHNPSVGTWLQANSQSPLLKQAQEVKETEAKRDAMPFRLKPSVGTWLTPIEPEEVVLGQTTTQMLTMSKECLIVTFKSQIEQREKEIQHLRQRLAK